MTSSDLLKTADDNDLQLEWGSLDSEKTIEMQDEFWFEKKYTNEYYTKLQNMFYTFSLEDAYYYIQNITFNIYSGYMSNSKEILINLIMQVFWIIVLTILSKMIIKKRLSKITIQGG